MRRALAPAMLITLLAIAAPARGGEASTIVEHCTHGQSLSGFSQNGYRQALAQLPTEVREYSECANEIRKAELAAISGTPGEASGSATPIPLTPAEQREVTRAHRHGSAPVKIAGRAVRPGVVHANIASVTSKLPTSLQSVLALLAAGGAAFALAKAYRRVRPGADR